METAEKTLQDEERELTEKVLQMVVSVGKDKDIDELKKVHSSFRVLQFVAATCIAEVAKDLDNLAEITDELTDRMGKLAIMIFAENQKKQVPAETIGTEMDAKSRLV